MSATAAKPLPAQYRIPDLDDYTGLSDGQWWILVPNSASDDDVHRAFQALEWLAREGKRPD